MIPDGRWPRRRVAGAVGLVVVLVVRARLAVSILLLMCAGGAAYAAPLPYAFVDHLSAPASAPAPPSAAAVAVREAITPATLEGDVRVLASPELRGRRRGTDENARARAYIAGRLRNAGLAPLFNGAFEQPAYADGTDTATPYATNVGAVYRAVRADAGWIVLVAHYDHLGVADGEVHPGADDNASSVALLLALGDALARARPALRRHVVLLFADAEEPPDVRTERMGSSWFWRHVPMPADRLHLAIVLDLIGGRAPPEMEAAGLRDALFVLGAEASRPLAEFVRSQSAAERVEPVFLGLPMIEATPYAPGRRFARSDYHGLREHLGRPFVFLSTGRTQTYHTPRDTPDTLDYRKLARVTRWVAMLTVRAADTDGALPWRDFVADPRADARTLLRMCAGIGDGARFAWPLRRTLAADRRAVEQLLRRWDEGEAPTPETYRMLVLASTRLQAALWRPRGWYFVLW
jgi:Peptidase family M28